MNRFSFQLKNVSKRKKVALAAGVIIIILGISIVAKNRNEKNGFVTEVVTNDTVTQIITETGVVKAKGITDIYSPSTGIVTSVSVKNGDVVAKGQTLFAVESTATKEEKQAANAAYLTASATRNAAGATANTLRSEMFSKWKTYRDLATNDTYETAEGSPKESERLAAEFQIAQDNWLAAEKKYKDQVTAIAAAEADVLAKREKYLATQNATVVAPAAGVVANLSVSQGDSLAAKSSTLPLSNANALGAVTGLPALTLITHSETELAVALGQTDIADIFPGQKVTIRPDSYREKEYHGEVLRVDSLGILVKDVVKFMVYVSVTDPDDKLKPGMTADADITTAHAENVLTVANSAIKPYKGGKAVRILRNGNKEPEYVPVEVGLKGKTRTQILSGLAQGEEIIVSVKNEQVKQVSAFDL